MVDLNLDARTALAKQVAAVAKAAREFNHSLTVDVKGHGHYNFPSARHWIGILNEEVVRMNLLAGGGDVSGGLLDMGDG